MKLDAIFVTTIERSKQMRETNLKKIGFFGRNYFNINVGFSGIDGLLLSNDQLQNYLNQGIIKPTQNNVTSLDDMVFMQHFAKKRFMTASEIGVFLSHFAYWNYIVKNNIQCALILEDDAYFEDEIFCNQIKDVLSDHDEMKYKMVSLFKHPKQNKIKNYRSFNNKYNRIDTRCWGLVSYLITLEGAKELLKYAVPISTPVDFTMMGIMERNNGGYIVSNSVVSLVDGESCIRDNYNNALSGLAIKTCNIDLLSIPIPKNIFTINNSNFKNENYEIKDIYHDFGSLPDSEIEKMIIEGSIMPAPNGDMSLTNKSNVVFSKSFGRFLTCDEISSYLSHYKIWEHIVEHQIPYAVILERNPGLQMCDFDSLVNEITNNAPCGFTTISLGVDNPGNGRVLEGNTNYRLADINSLGTNAYIISLLGAIMFVKKLKIVEDRLDMAIRRIETENNSGYLYIKEAPKIIELDVQKQSIHIEQLYFLGENYNNVNDILQLKPNFFKIDENNIDIQNLVNMNNGIVNQNCLREGGIMLEQEKRLMTNQEISNYLANVSIWSIMVEQNINCALIMNKNVQFNSSLDKLQTLIDNLPHRGEIISFVNTSEYYLKCNEYYTYFHNKNNELPAYLITLSGAKKLLKIHKPIRSTIESLVYTYGCINKVGYMPRGTFFV